MPRRQKRYLIDKAIREHDIEALKSYALSDGGLLNAGLRARAWPALLGFHPDDVFPPCSSELELFNRRDPQIANDTKRSFLHFKNVNFDQLESKRHALELVLNSVALRNPNLYYFQGFHDVCCVFLLVVGETRALGTIERASEKVFKDHHREEFEATIATLDLLFPVIKEFDAELHETLITSKVEPFLGLPWLITAFAHTFSDLPKVARIYDAVLASGPEFSLFLCAAAVLSRKHALNKLTLKERSDMASVHACVSRLPESTDVDLLVRTAMNVRSRVDFKSLLIDSKVPKDSLLWTSPAATTDSRRREDASLVTKAVYVGLAVVWLRFLYVTTVS